MVFESFNLSRAIGIFIGRLGVCRHGRRCLLLLNRKAIWLIGKVNGTIIIIIRFSISKHHHQHTIQAKRVRVSSSIIKFRSFLFRCLERAMFHLQFSHRLSSNWPRAPNITLFERKLTVCLHFQFNQVEISTSKQANRVNRRTKSESSTSCGDTPTAAAAANEGSND